MNWHLTIWTFAVWAILAGVYQLGWRIGRKYGQDEQWVEDVLADARRDLARRDACGRFRSLNGKN